MILHKEVPELVYLQTRKLLRDVHYKRASIRQTVGVNSLEPYVSKKEEKEVYNPNLQSMRSEHKVQVESVDVEEKIVKRIFGL